MSDKLQHECGIAMIRLLKPLEYYKKKYGTSRYALNKMYLLMEKQHNRGQDGAGLANVKFDMKPGQKYISIEKSIDASPIKDVFERVNSEIQNDLKNKPADVESTAWLKENSRFSGEIFLGHLRYGTFGKNQIENCHPFLRENNWVSRNLLLAGNFNLTNVQEIIKNLLRFGQHPKSFSDTVTILEKIGHFIDEENKRLFRKYRDKDNVDITELIQKEMDIESVLQNACRKWDGGFVIAGVIGHGDSFVMRDPAGIRPAFYYADDEIIVIASERPVIQTALNVPAESIKEITPAHALIIKKDGSFKEVQYITPLEKKPCSFERIYFSRGTDIDIYNERKKLGKILAYTILDKVNNDLKNTVFSYIPNTAETSYIGLVEEVKKQCVRIQKDELSKLGHNPSHEDLDRIFSIYPRVEKIAVKDAKLRTFITDDESRNELVAHVYDVTYGTVKPDDNLVIIDDSIVRGTTLRESIIKILDRLGPKKIMIVSSAPQIRYPDCYGIDMAKLGDLIAFSATIELLKESGQQDLIDQVYKEAKAQTGLPDKQVVNSVVKLYEQYTDEQISAKIAQMITPEGVNADVEVVYQTIEGLHKSCPYHKGDWYFSGDYPTPGGNRVVNRAFINYIEGINARAY